jgi:hypothetical protein
MAMAIGKILNIAVTYTMYGQNGLGLNPCLAPGVKIFRDQQS